MKKATPFVETALALLLYYSLGLGCMASGKHALLKRILVDTRLRKRDRSGPAVACLRAYQLIDRDIVRTLPGLDRRHTPMSDHLLEMLRGEFGDLAANADDFEDMFDRFEIMSALVFFDLNASDDTLRRVSPPIGRFMWRGQSDNDGMIQQMSHEASKLAAEWPPIKQQLFGGSYERYEAAKAAFDGYVAQQASNFL